MIKSRLIIFFAAVLFLTGCNSNTAMIKQAHAAVAQNLYDPDSAKFRDDDVGLEGTVCGEVNAKNRMGGYVGFTFYMWTEQGGAAEMPSADSVSFGANSGQIRQKLVDMCNFVQHWATACSKDQRAFMVPMLSTCKKAVKATSR